MIACWRKAGACSKAKFLSLLFPAPVSYTRCIVDTPTETPAARQVANAYAEEFVPQMQPAQQSWPAQAFGPDNPPWGVTAALLVWLASVGLLFIVPTLAGAAYVITRLHRLPADHRKAHLLPVPHLLLLLV